MDCVFVWEKEQISQKWEMDRQRDGRTYHDGEDEKESECNFEWMHLNAMNKHKRHITCSLTSVTPTQKHKTWETIFSLTFHYYHTTCCNAWILYCIMYVFIRITTIFSLYNLQKRREKWSFWFYFPLYFVCMESKLLRLLWQELSLADESAGRFVCKQQWEIFYTNVCTKYSGFCSTL